jgi:hypothetical protein
MKTYLSEAGIQVATGYREWAKGSSAKKDRCDNSRSYRCLLHLWAMLRRPRTARFHWRGILREIHGTQIRRSGLAGQI